MIVEKTPLEGVLLIKPKVFGDERGFFLESWHAKRYQEVGITQPFVQDNHSRSRHGVLRGMHYQLQNPQGKLVRCSVGRVFDAVLDIRQGSPTFGQWWGVELTSENHWQVWVPPDFAHGFCVLSPSADFQYKCTDYYNPADEGAVYWEDPAVGIQWPAIDTPWILSAKDIAAQRLHQIPTDRLPALRKV